MPQNTVWFSQAYQIPVHDSIDAHVKHEPVIVILSTKINGRMTI